jgi:hypothetical protein
MKLIDKDAFVVEIEKLKADALQKKSQCKRSGLERITHQIGAYNKVISLINTLEVKDPYEQCVQYDSVKDGLQAHAETYSFNIESILFHQLTKEQQKLWRKEIEQACISGGEMGVELARDTRYKEKLEVKEMDLEKEIDNVWNPHFNLGWDDNSLLSINHKSFESIAKYFFELGLKVQKGKEEGHK